jgi:hypothetical protein
MKPGTPALAAPGASAPGTHGKPQREAGKAAGAAIKAQVQVGKLMLFKLL